MTLLLKNATLVHLHPPGVLASTDVAIEGGLIARVGRSRGAAGPAHPPDRTLDLAGKVLMPGIVCGHTHFYSALARGVLARIAPSADFVQTLQNLWWRLDRAIDREILEASALAAALEAVQRGCTCIVDHHASPSFIEGSLDVIASCLERVGLRGVLCYETTDRNGPEGAAAGIGENRRFARRVEAARLARGPGAVPALVEATIGGHAPFTLGDATLDGLSRVVRETGRGFHVHVCEDAYDASHSHRVHGQDPLARVAAHGLLTDRAIIGHGVHLGAADRELLVQSGAFLAHNARSNMNNHVGYQHALPSLPRVALGTDGIGSDMFEEFRAAFFKHRDAGGPLWPGDFARFLQAGNDLVQRCFGGTFGSIEPGAVADLAVLDYRPPTPLVDENVAGHLAYGISSADVETVIVNGRVVLENRRFPFDTEPVLRQARDAARKLWANMDALEE
ncbi:MAG TPA: putative aminohydrolase SsnA [Desulfobacterales bacterium]|nr:putative aminohydrolase SsnA [Desulfobacterales bacterium]